jgi:tellurite resistance protein
MTAIIFNRIIFHHQMAAKFTPTLFIFIAPPAVAMISYVRMTGHFDFFATMLLDLGLFFTLLVLFMFRSFLGLRYFISWWAFTFPLTAVTIATMVAWHATKHGAYYWLSWGLLILASVVVFVVAWQTLRHMFKKEICVME